MIAVLFSGLALVAAVSVGNLVIGFALIRRVRELESGHSSASAAHGDSDLPVVGTAVGRFEATDTGGASVTDRDLNGKAFVGFVLPGCGPCQDIADAAHNLPEGSTLFFIRDDEQHPDEVRSLTEKLARVGRVVSTTPDNESVFTTAFGGINGYPTMLRIEKGTIVAASFRLDAVLR